jgi:hypothetical protein
MNRRMKKLSLLLLVTLIFNSKIASAQNLINAGFENWTNVIIFNEPTGYVSSNYFSIILGTGGLPRANVSKSTGVKHGGTYAAKLESYAQNTGDSLGVPGLIITGSLDIASAAITPGFPYVGRPAELRGFYKYAQGLSTDSGTALVSLTKRNILTGQQEAIAVGFGVFSNKTTFGEFTVPLFYASNEMPDTAIIVFSTTSTLSTDPAALTSAPVGSILYLDDLSFYGSVAAGLESIDALLQVSAYPNPSSDLVNITFVQKAAGAGQLMIRDLTGKLIYQQEIQLAAGKNEIPVATKDWNSGLYLYQINTPEGIVNRSLSVIK